VAPGNALTFFHYTQKTEQKSGYSSKIWTGEVSMEDLTQYFIGQFDGKAFINDHSPAKALWLDYGADNYAGVTWFGAPITEEYLSAGCPIGMIMLTLFPLKAGEVR